MLLERTVSPTPLQLRILELWSMTGTHAAATNAQMNEWQSSLLYTRRHFSRCTTVSWDVSIQLTASTYPTQFFSCGNKVWTRATLVLQWNFAIGRRKTSQTCLGLLRSSSSSTIGDGSTNAVINFLESEIFLLLYSFPHDYLGVDLPLFLALFLFRIGDDLGQQPEPALVGARLMILRPNWTHVNSAFRSFMDKCGTVV